MSNRFTVNRHVTHKYSVYNRDVSEEGVSLPIATSNARSLVSYTITFTVLDLEGNPIMDANVKCESFLVINNLDGTYRAFEVPDGEYTYNISKDGYTSVEDKVVVDGANVAITEELCQYPIITSNENIYFIMGEPIGIQLKYTGCKPGTWSVVSGSLPNGITLNQEGIVSGTSTEFGARSVTIKVVNPCGEATKIFNFDVCALPEIKCEDLIFPYEVGVSECLHFSGTKPGEWSVIEGKLPAGLTLSKKGVISGTPTSFGSFDVVLKVENPCGFSTKEINILVCAKPQITSNDDMQFIMDEAGSYQLQMFGTPGVWSVSEGVLPEGLVLNAETGLISGTPVVFGNFTFTVKVVNPCGEATQYAKMFVCGKPSIATEELNLVAGVASNERLLFLGSRPGTWSVVAGALPNGLSLNPQTGFITGTTEFYGNLDITFKIVNPCGEATKRFLLVVCGKPSITSGNGISFIMGEAGEQQLTSSGTPGTWSVDELPDGLELDPETGIISGTATVSGSYNFLATVTNSCGSASKNMTVFICAKPQITTDTLDFVSGEEMSQKLAFTGSRPGTWSIEDGELPLGLSLNGQTGIVSGTTKNGGDFAVTFKVVNPCGEAVKEISVFVCEKPEITCGCNLSFVMGETGEAKLTSSGTPGTWSIDGGSLPAGLTLDPETGIISGTPTVSGNFNFTVKVVNPCGVAYKDMRLFICAKPQITTGDLDLVMGEEDSKQLQFLGSRPGTWSVEGLPHGLRLDAEAGVISGKSVVFGEFTLLVKVENPCGEVEKEITMFVCGKPQVTSNSNINFEADVVSSFQLTSSGTPGTWSMIDGELPEGITLNASGVLSGTPTESGNFNFTVKVVNPCGEATQNINVFVCALPVIKVDNMVLLQNMPFEKQLIFAGSRSGRWSVSEGKIPNGLELSRAGVLSGIPNHFGDFNFTLKVVNPCGEDTKTINIKVERTYNVNFTVENENGDPIADAIIKIGDFLVVNNGDGTYQAKLTQGVHTYTVSRDGFVTFEGTVEVKWAELNVLVTLCVAPAILTESFNFVMGVFGTQQIESTGTPGVFSIVAGELPDGLVLDGDVIKGTATEYGSFEVKLLLENLCGEVTKNITIGVCAKPEITSSDEMGIVVNTPTSKQLEFSGSTPGTWSIVSGAMPDGLSLNSETGLISGTATEFGDFEFTVKVVNACGEDTQEIFSFVCVLPTITTSEVSFVKLEEDSVQLEFSGSIPGEWSLVSGTLPAGLTLSESGLISGTVTEFGLFKFTVKVVNPCGETTKEISANICAKPEITSDSDMSLVRGSAVSIELTAFGTPGKWRILSGSLPTGLTLNEETGVISGTPTVDGDFTFVVRVTNSCGSSRQTISMFVCAMPVITSEGNLNFVINEASSEQLTYSGTGGVWSISNGELPDGLEFSSNGLISGTPIESGNYNFTVKITNSCGEATKNINLFVCALPVITSENIEFLQNTPVSQQLQFTGSRPGTWSVVSGAFPAGITLSKNGLVSGTTSQFGEFNVTVKVVNPCGEDTKVVSMFTCAKPIITSDNSIDFTIGETDSIQLEYIGTAGTWEMIAGEMPDGVELDENGLISGTPTVSGSWYFTAKVVNPCGEAVKKFSLHVCALPTITSGDISFVQNTPVEKELKYIGSRPGTWSIVAGALPTGLTLNAKTGVISGTTQQFGDFSVTVKVANLCGETTKVINVLTCAKPTITNVNLSFAVGQAGSQQLECTGTPGTWAIVDGVLPAGLELDADTGIVSGTPTVSGTFNFTVKLENGCGEDEKVVYVHICALPVITTGDISYQINTPVSEQLQFTGSRPGAWTIVSGSLPTGLSLNSASGIISGTPTEFGSFEVTLKVVNNCGEATKTIEIVGCAEPVITCCCDMTFTMGEAGSVQLESTGTPGIWSISEGALPGGLELDEETGIISGTPTASGSFAFTIKLENPCGETTQSINLSICNKPAVLSGDMEFVMGTAATKQLQFSGSRPGTWSVSGDLPAGLKLDAEKGTISGTATEFGEFDITLIITNPCGSASKEVNIFVCGKPEIVCCCDMEFSLDEAGSVQLEATGTPGTWSVDSGKLPNGLELDPDTGIISGTPTESGIFTFVIKLTNPCGEAIQNINMVVCSQPAVISGDMDFVMGEPVSKQLIFSGSRPGKWSIVEGALPAGLTLNADTGVISGTATEFGDFTFTVKIENFCGEATKELNMFTCAKPTVTSNSIMNFVMGVAGTAQCECSGTPGVWSIVAGELPTGLVLDPETGEISGTPTVSGHFVFTIQIKNSCGEATQEVNMFVCALPEITSGDIDFVMGTAGTAQFTFTGSRPGTWSVEEGVLPAGLTLNAETGVVSGTATEFGNFEVTIKVENPCGEDEKEIIVVVCGKPEITSGESMNFVMGEEDSAQLTSSGTAGTWTIVSGVLPEGLELDAETGEISGTPTESGHFTFVVKVTNDCGEATKEIDLFSCAKPQVTSAVSLDFTKGEAGTFELTFSGSRPGTWSLEEGHELPTGLTLDGATGIISGTPTVSGEFLFIVKVVNPCGEATKEMEIVICEKPEITSDAHIDFVVGEESSTQLEHSGTSGVWSIDSGDFPAGLTLDAETGEISGIPTVAGHFTFIVNFANPCGEASKEIHMFCCGKPQITSGDIEYLQDEAVSLQLTFTGSRPGTWSLEEGHELPTGLTLDPDTGIISGTVTELGTSTFVVKVVNPCGEDEKEINIFICAEPEITSDSNINFVMGEEESFQLVATGYPGTWSIVEGDFPDGLELDEETGEISGIPTVFGNFVFTVKITNPCGEDTQEINMFICALPEITSGDMTFVMGEYDSSYLQSSGTPGTFSIVEGVLPTGLVLGVGSGIIHGTPTEFGIFVITLKITNDCGEATKEVTIFVCAKPEITSEHEVDFVMGEPFSIQLTATGTQGVWSIVEGVLPTELTLYSDTGIISGIATEHGEFKFTVKVTNDCGEATQEIDMFVCGKPIITSGWSISFFLNEEDSYQLTQDGTEGTWEIIDGVLPNGVTFDGSTGIISGTATQAGRFVFVVKLVNPCGEITKEMDMYVCEFANIITRHFDFVMGEPISQVLNFTGSRPGNFSIVDGALPDGLILSADGTISGTATEYGDFTVTVRVTNPCGDKDCEITIFCCGKPEVTSDSNMDFVLGQYGSAQLENFGTEGTWEIVDGALPNGLTLDPDTGVIDGTPSESGDFVFTVKITNVCGEGTQVVNLFVCVLPEITSSPNWGFVMGEETVPAYIEYTGSTPGTFSIIEGALPNGLVLDSDTGIITGTPTEFGDFEITIKVENYCGEATQEVKIFVCAKPGVLTTDIEFVMNIGSTQQLESFGTEGTWSIVDGILPDGLTLYPDTGMISGSATEFGDFEITVKVVNSCGEATGIVNIFVCGMPEIIETPTSYPNMKFVMGEDDHSAILEYVGTTPGTWSISEGVLPDGLTLDPDTGVIGGNPTEHGDFVFTVRIENYCGADEKEINMFVCGKPEILTTDLEYVMNEFGTQQLESSGSTGLWSVAFTSAYNLPVGLWLNPETGEISGIPTQYGDFAVTIKIENGCGEDEKVVNIFVCGKPEIPDWGLTMFFIMGEEDYSNPLQSFGTPGTFSIVGGALPNGITLDPDTGIIGGTATEWGDFTFSIKVENSCGEMTVEMHMTVCVIAEIEDPEDEEMSGVFGEPFSYQLKNTGMAGTWSVASTSADNLPPGLFLNSATGAITGTPTAFGDFVVTFQFNNPCCEVTQEMTFYICGLPEITSDEFHFVMGEAGEAQLEFIGTQL